MATKRFHRNDEWKKQSTLIQERAQAIAALAPDVKDFSWDFTLPKDPYHQIGKFPVYAGRGAEKNLSRICHITHHGKIENARNAFKFVEKILHPIQAKFVNAIGIPGEDFADHIGASPWWTKFNDRIQWTAFETETKEKIVFMSKRVGNLYHRQVYKDQTLFHESHVLLHRVKDGKPLNLHADKEMASFIRTMTYQAIHENKPIYNHCQAGIGRGPSMAATQVVFIQHAPDLEAKTTETGFSKVGDLHVEPQINDEGKIKLNFTETDYPKKLVKDLQKHRPGALGYKTGKLGSKLMLNTQQLQSVLKDGAHLLELHAADPVPERTIESMVSFTPDEINEVMSVALASLAGPAPNEDKEKPEKILLNIIKYYGNETGKAQSSGLREIIAHIDLNEGKNFYTTFTELKTIIAQYVTEFSPTVFDSKPLTPIQLLLKSINEADSLDSIIDNACFKALRTQYRLDSELHPRLLF